MTAKKAKAGRPSQSARLVAAPIESGRVQLAIRAKGEVLEKLDEAARKLGHSRSREAERRLEESFNEGRALESMAAPAYSPEIAGLLMLLGRVIHDVVQICGDRDAPPQTAQSALPGLDSSSTKPAEQPRADRPRTWLESAYAFNQVEEAIGVILTALRPEGVPAPPAVEEDPAAAEFFGKVGKDVGCILLAAVRGESPLFGRELGEWAAQVRIRLGSTAGRIRVPFHKALERAVDRAVTEAKLAEIAKMPEAELAEFAKLPEAIQVAMRILADLGEAERAQLADSIARLLSSGLKRPIEQHDQVDRELRSLLDATAEREARAPGRRRSGSSNK